MADWKQFLVKQMVKLSRVSIPAELPQTGSDPCIVVPTHSPHLDVHAETSFRRCLEIFDGRAIILLVPEGMDTSAYRRIGAGFREFRVPVDWQSSLKAYNQMKCRVAFYEMFQEFSHMLTYELDAYAFRDELDQWCAKPFDYIGAPWFAHYAVATPADPMTGVGNSGFSLRRISSCLLATRFWDAAQRDLKQPPFSLLAKYPLNHLNQVRSYAEDTFWSTYAQMGYPQFSVAPLDEARKFSFEVNPALLYELNGKSLPFGCHKWFQYDPAFWAQFIESGKSS